MLAPIALDSRSRLSATTALSPSGSGLVISRRPTMSSCLVIRAARSAAAWICSMSAWTVGLSDVFCAANAEFMMTASRLLNSCATPPASLPRLSSRSV